MRYFTGNLLERIVDNPSLETKQELLRHLLATLAYRGTKCIQNVPESYPEYRAGNEANSPVEILAHIGDLLDWSTTIVMNEGKWHTSKPLPWEEEKARFYEAMARLDAALLAGHPQQFSYEQILQGPLLDAFTHVGQLAMIRRLAGSPIRGEVYIISEIKAGQMSANQPPPIREF